MEKYAVMPEADYLDACDAVREKTGGTEAIKSGDLGAQIRAIASGGVPKAIYVEDNGDDLNGHVSFGPIVLSKSDYGYLLNCTHLFIVPGGAKATGFSALINIATGGSVVLVNGGEVNTSLTFQAMAAEGYEGGYVGEDELSINVVPPRELTGYGTFPPGDYYIVGATL